MVAATVCLALWTVVNGFVSAMHKLSPMERPRGGSGSGLLGLVLSYGFLVAAIVLAWRSSGWMWGVGAFVLGFWILAPIFERLILGVYSHQASGH
jgi:hypothetical protein